LTTNKLVEVFREEDVLSISELTDLFSGSTITKFLERGVIQPSGTDLFRVTFVGVVIADGRAIQIIPKIFDPSLVSVPEVMLQVVRSLRRYARWLPNVNEDAPFIDANARRERLNIIAIADWLISDYSRNGIYRRLRHHEIVNGDGMLNWKRTIERMSPVISGRSPIYTDVITRNSSQDREHLISRLHKYVIEHSFKDYGYLMGYAPLSLDHEPFEPLSDLPNISVCINRVNSEIQNAFSDRALHLLSMIRSWLEARMVAVKSGLALYGMSAFHVVWEQACSHLIGNQRESWQGFIPRPQWKSSNGEVQSSETFRPDIVNQINGPGGKYLLIADAKYYRLTMPPALSGQPGVNDIAKQLWYEECLSPPAKHLGLVDTVNVFVVPGSGGSKMFWSDGEVSLVGLARSRVGIKRLSGLYALRSYADGTTISAAELERVVFER